MIIFSQGPTAHSRLGNSIDWMSKFQYALDELNISYIFPWGAENFHKYLHQDSKWLNFDEKASSYFLDKFDFELNAVNLSKFSRSMESVFEKSNFLDPYGWRRLIYSDEVNDILYLTGNVDLTRPDIISEINRHQYTVCHEPFNFVFRYDFDLIGLDYSSLIPKQDLYEREADFVQEHSKGKLKVGLHIRRGDYKSWQQGSYYYDDAYWLRNVKKLIAMGSSVWIFSNDLASDFESNLISLGANISKSEFHVDFVRMMFMDKVYGPPSTFSVNALKIASKCFNLTNSFYYLPPKR